jgi:hypothetical protein
MGRFTWVKCDGGPHVLLPSELEAIWSGTHAPSDRRVVKATFRWKPDPLTPASDYDAACDVDEKWPRKSEQRDKWKLRA